MWRNNNNNNMKVTIVPLVIGAFGTITKGLLEGLEDLEIDGRVETIQMTALLNPEMSPGDLRRLAVTQTPVKNHQLTLMWKTLKEYIMIIMTHLYKEVSNELKKKRLSNGNDRKREEENFKMLLLAPS